MQQPNGLINSVIDTAAFYGGNAIVHNFYPEDKIKIDDAFIYLLGDIVVRNTTYFDGMLTTYDEKNKRNLIISLLYVGIKTLDNYARSSESKLMNNVIKGAVGFVSNTAVDMIITPKLI